MKLLLNLEEWGIFLLCVFLFSRLDFAWWWFPALLLLPDVAMLGYLISPKLGALTYNLFHHRILAAGIATYGLWLGNDWMQLAAIVLFAHISMDRAMGYGLKYEDSFFNTHLGRIGKGK